MNHRTLNYADACTQIECLMAKYRDRMRSRKALALISITLAGLRHGEGDEVANVAITRYHLNSPANGSHKWFGSDTERPRVLDIDPDFVVPEEWKIMPLKDRGEIDYEMERLIFMYAN